MDISHINEILGLLSSCIATVILPMLLIRSQKRKADAEASQAEANNAFSISEEWKDLYDKRDLTVAEKDKKIDSLYDEIREIRKTNRELEERISQLTIENQALMFRRCNKHGCPDRTPPSEY